MGHLTFILFHSGNGNDPQLYRPKKDETQWWGRRDAQCRCTAAALYGPLSIGEDRQLVFLHDEDISLLRMRKRRTHSSSTAGTISLPRLPSESNLIKTWKRAVMASADSHLHKGECWFESHPWRNNNASWEKIQKESGTGNRKIDIDVISDSLKEQMMQSLTEKDLKLMKKREVLLELQRCIDLFHNSFSLPEGEIVINFLRKWKLNSSSDVVLRKTNHETLVKAYLDFFQSVVKRNINNEISQCSMQSTDVSNNSYEGRLHSTLCNIFSEHGKINDFSNSIVVYLHETCIQELPVFGILNQFNASLSSDIVNNSSNATFNHIYVILGAVRDITMREYEVIEMACQRTLKIPLVGCNLGPIIEFTSKIISAIAFHSYMGVLNASVKKLYHEAKSRKQLGIEQMEEDQMDKIMKKKLLKQVDKNEMVVKNSGSRPHVMHVICFIPFVSRNLTPDLSKRDCIIWNIVRMCVCTLWRSRMVSSSSKGTAVSTDRNDTADHENVFKLENILSLVFQDGYVMTLHQNDLVQSLAVKHQAAPSEYQILKALCDRRDADLTIPIRAYKKEDSNVADTSVDWGAVWKETALHNDLKSSDRSSFFFDLCNNEQNSSIYLMKELLDIVYGSPCECDKLSLNEDDSKTSWHLYTALKLPCLSNQSECFSSDLTKNMQQSLYLLFQEHAVPVISNYHKKRNNSDERIDFVDGAGSTITMLQHFIYHSRLFSSLCCLDVSRFQEVSRSKKRKLRKSGR